MKSIKEIFSFLNNEESKKIQSVERNDHSLERFVDSQERMYERALAEVKSGKKLSHWIWYIFPQLKGLGSSNNSIYYGIDDIEEARAYLNHSVLGTRLREITEVLLQSDKSTEEIFGSLDAMKVRSCMTLFDEVSEDDLFCEVLQKHYQDKPDEKTLKIIECFYMPKRKYGWGAIIGCLYAQNLEERNFWQNKDKRFNSIPHYNSITFDVSTTIAWASNLLYKTDLSKFHGIENSIAGYLWHSNYRSFYSLPYCTYGHGKAMHTSILGWVYNTLEETIHEVAIRRFNNNSNASQAIASCVFLARKGKNKQEIKDFIENEFGYDLNRTCAEIRSSISALYDSIDKERQWFIEHFNISSPYSFPKEFEGNYKQYETYYFNLYAPEAIICFLESKNFEDAIQLAVSLNTDSPDTLGGMVGAIAEAFYGDIYFNNISALLFNISQGLDNLPIEIKRIMKRFSLRFGNKL